MEERAERGQAGTEQGEEITRQARELDALVRRLHTQQWLRRQIAMDRLPWPREQARMQGRIIAHVWVMTARCKRLA